jgi:hypothetical protein
MNVGECLDTAAAALIAAAARIRAEAHPDPYDIYGTLTARDLVYQGLGRLTALIRNQDPSQHTVWEDIPLLRAAGSTGPGSDGGHLLAACIQLARLNREQHVDFALLTKHGTIPALIAPAANAIGIAAEIVATHLNPGRPLMSGGHRAGLKNNYSGRHFEASQLSTDALAYGQFRTIEGAAIAIGAHRTLGLGEVARLGALAIEVDSAMMHWTDAWYNGESLRIGRLLASAVPLALGEIGRSPPAILLRELEPAPVFARPSGPRPVDSLHDVLTAISAARLAVYNRWSHATVGLAIQTARLGFALTATISRINGEGTSPSPVTEEHAIVWRSIAMAANDLADIRDGQDNPFPSELGSAALWLRQHTPQISNNPPSANGDWTSALQRIQADLRKLCAEMIEPLRSAVRYRMILTSQQVFRGRIKAGIQVAETKWQTARAGHSALAKLVAGLHAASKLPVTPTTSAFVKGGQTTLTVTSKLGKAFPAPIGPSSAQRRSTTTRDLKPRQDKAAGREL